MIKKTQKTDPFFEQEAKKYDNPIPSRQFIMQTLEEAGCPLAFAQLVDLLEIEEGDKRDALHYRLKAMLRDGQLMKDRRHRYCLVDKVELQVGVVIGHPDGYGFVALDKGGQDLFLNAKQMRCVFPGDRVLVTAQGQDRRGKRDGVIVEVIERNTKQLVGRFFYEQGVAYVEPDNKRICRDIVLAPEEAKKAQSGQFVVVELTSQPDLNTPPMGKVIEVLGDHLAPGMEIDVAIRSYGLPYEWPDALIDELGEFQETVNKKDCEHRFDKRDLSFVTIDGEDAKDFDDAVFCERLPRGWRLLVAIADVGHYVKPGSALDEEAKLRGNSVYFPERVIPMLPEVLSNGLCSLKPKVDRLALICEMHLTPKGRVSKSTFYHGVIHSQARLTYTEVAAFLKGETDNFLKKYPHLGQSIENLYGLYGVLRQARAVRGAIEFDTTETQFIFDAEKKIEKIVPLIRNDAHRLIEECMLLANVCAADFIEKAGYPSLYRVHPAPNPDKVNDLRQFLSELGLQLKGKKEPKPKDYVNLLASIVGRPDAHLIQTVLLRSLSQAIYSTDNRGHFGLAYMAYTHFTSPIRRYPDLLIHRTITHILENKEKIDFPYDAKNLEAQGQHCSYTERRADEATRDVDDWLKCEFMHERVGEVFEGIISSVTHFGLFVELKETYVEGLVHVTSLTSDYYRYDATKHYLRGERTGKIYRLGDPIVVQLLRVSLDDRKIDFGLVEAQ